MKIAIFTGTYLPQINGVVTSTRTFAHELEKLGHRVLIIGPKMKGAGESTDKVWRFRSLPFPFQPEHRIISPLSRKLKQFRDMHFDIIHIQTPFFIGHLAQHLSKKYGIPMVHTYHTYWMEYLHYFPLLPKHFRRRADSLFTKNFCNRCQYVIVPSESMREKLIEQGVTVPMRVIPTGIDVEETKKKHDGDAFRRKYRVGADEKLLIFVGRLGKEKNIFFLLDAFKIVSDRVPNSRLFIAGDGPEKEKLLSYAENHGVLDRVISPGYISHKAVLTAYAASDVIAFPSKTETQGLSLLEGLSMGKPAVGLVATGVKDILAGDVGGFLADETPEAFGAKLIELLTDPALRQRKGEEALARAHEYSSTEMAKRLVGVYETVIENFKKEKKHK